MSALNLLAVLLLSSLAAAPAFAEPMDAEAFDAATLGRTMTWAQFGTVYGLERYLPGRRVRWTETGQECISGHWYPQGDTICFQYEDRPDPVCWTITADAAGLSARETLAPPDLPPVSINTTDLPMACLGPDVGA